MNKLIIVISGKKGAGKTSLAKFILCEYLNRKIGKKRFTLEKKGKEVLIIDTFNNNQVLHLDFPNADSRQIANIYSTKIYSFADPLKRICTELLGLDEIQCYGTDDDKNSQTHISWDTLSEDLRKKYTKVRRGTGGKKPASGQMTSREVMQVLADDMIRSMDENAFARGLYSILDEEQLNLSLVADCRYPNEVTLGTERGAKVIRLSRTVAEDDHKSEHALDDFPLGEFTLYIDNQNMTMQETHEYFRPYMLEWFERYKVI